MTTQGLQNYLNHLVSGLPGGVECGYCHQVNTYEHVSLKWKDLGEDNYSFRQIVRCDRCGFKQGYEWEQHIAPNFRFTMSLSNSEQENKNA